MRLRLKYEDEAHTPANWFTSTTKRKAGDPDLSTRVKEKAETIYILERHELDSQKLRLIGDKCTSQADLKRKLGQLSYLQSLKTTDYGKKVSLIYFYAVVKSDRFPGRAQPREMSNLHFRAWLQLGRASGQLFSIKKFVYFFKQVFVCFFKQVFVCFFKKEIYVCVFFLTQAAVGWCFSSIIFFFCFMLRATSICVHPKQSFGAFNFSVPVRALLLRGLHPDPDKRVQPGQEHQVCSLPVRLNTDPCRPSIKAQRKPGWQPLS